MTRENRRLPRRRRGHASTMGGDPPARSRAPRDEHLVLVGSMGVGKSTVGRLLAAGLGRPLRDSDVDLEAGQRRTGRTVAAESGVDELHRWEAEHLLQVLGEPEPAVVTAAASVVDDDRCVEALGQAFVVWLRASPATLARRIAGRSHRRELGPDLAAALHRLEARRAPRYAAVADLTVDVDTSAPEQTAEQVLGLVRAASRG